MDIDLSSSTMSFLRATGPDISLEDVFQDILSESRSSSSSDASSTPNEDQVIFMAMQSHCATISLFHRRGTPCLNEHDRLRNSLVLKPILIETPKTSGKHAEENPITGLELVPWKPCYPALLLQLWPEIVQASWCRTSSIAHQGCILQVTEQGSSGPEGAESHTAEQQPSPPPPGGKKKLPRRPRKFVSLPSTLSSTSSPLLESSVRRSSRLNKNDGFCAVRLEREPAKKRKINIVRIDDHTGEAGPVPLAVLQSWGIDCGITPLELFDDTLMQTPPPHESINEDINNENVQL